MRNYIRADVKRILQRSSHLFSMLLLFAIYVLSLYLPNRGPQVTSVTLVAFAGTILEFVPADMIGEYTARMNSVFREGAVTELMIRADGAYAVEF